jgi:hypothetical protein
MKVIDVKVEPATERAEEHVFEEDATVPGVAVGGNGVNVAADVGAGDVAVTEVTVGMKSGITPGATAEMVGIGPGTAGVQAAMMNTRIREAGNLWDIWFYFLKLIR